MEPARLRVSPGVGVPEAWCDGENDPAWRLGPEEELALLDEDALVRVTREHELRACVCECCEHVEAVWDRPFPGSPGRSRDVMVQRHHTKRFRSNVLESRGNPIELLAPERTSLPLPRPHRVQRADRHTVRLERSLGLRPGLLEVRERPHIPGRWERGDVVVAGDRHDRGSKRAKEGGPALELFPAVAVRQIAGGDNELWTPVGDELDDSGLDLGTTLVVAADM